MKCVPEDDQTAVRIDMLLQVAYAEYRDNVEQTVNDNEEVEILRDRDGREIIKVVRKCFEDACVLCYEVDEKVIKMIEDLRDIHDARQLLRYIVDRESDTDLNLTILEAPYDT